jgi:hypothetical protein
MKPSLFRMGSKRITEVSIGSATPLRSVIIFFIMVTTGKSQACTDNKRLLYVIHTVT